MDRLPSMMAGLGQVKMWLIRSPLAVALAFMMMMFFLGSAEAKDIACRKGDDFRRVQLVIADDRTGLPCEVILWSTPTEQRRVWRAQFERGFCAEKLYRFVKSLADDQWRCYPTNALPIKRRLAGHQPVM